MQASTLDGVLGLKNEHFWTIAFGSYVSVADTLVLLVVLLENYVETKIGELLYVHSTYAAMIGQAIFKPVPFPPYYGMWMIVLVVI